MKKFYLTLAAGALSAVPLFAADPAPAAPAKAEAPQAEAAKVDVWKLIPDVVATVDGKPVTKAELIAYAGQVPSGFTPELVAQQVPGIVRRMLTERLFEADFEARKPQVSKEEADELMKKFLALPPQQQQQFKEQLAQEGLTIEKFVNDKIAQEKFFKTVILKDCEVTDEEAKKLYDAHANEFPEVTEASHILVRVKSEASEADKKAALDKINRIAEELKKDPAKFEEIAKKESDDPGTKAQGGKLPPFTSREMVPEFATAAFALKKGEISGVVKTKFGYHIIRCDAAPYRMTFEMLKNDIKQMLRSQKEKQAVGNYVEGLMKQHKVEILVKAPKLPAPAQAAPAEPAAPAAK